MPVTKNPAQSIVKRTVSAEVHKQIAQDEDENTGLQAIHTAEQGGENVLHTVQNMRQSKLQHDHTYLQKEQEIKHPEAAGSNPISRAYQRRAIRKEYMAAKAGKSTGSAYASSTAAKKAVRRTGDTAEKTVSAIFRKKSYLLILGLAAMLMFVMNAISSCTPLVEAGLHAFVMGTYPAEERDVKAAERAYKTKEDELKRELERRGYSVGVLNTWNELGKTGKPKYDAKVVVTHAMYHDGIYLFVKDFCGNVPKVVNMQCEQVGTIKDDEAEDSRMILKGIAKQCMNICWGDCTVERLKTKAALMISTCERQDRSHWIFAEKSFGDIMNLAVRSPVDTSCLKIRSGICLSPRLLM